MSVTAFNFKRVAVCAFVLLTTFVSFLAPVDASAVVINPNNPTSGNILLQKFSHDPSTGTLSGSLWVNNLAFTKIVRVFYSNPSGTGWTTANFVDASYSSSAASNQEVWNFSVTNSALIQPGTQFYVQYTVNGASYYDNNGNTNYKVPAGGVISVNINPTTPSFGNVKLGSYQFDGSSLSASIWVKNLAFNKVVSVSYTNAATGATVTVPAGYVSGPASTGYEVWAVSAASVASGAFGGGSQISVTFVVSGSTFTDGPYAVPSSGVTVLPPPPTSTVTLPPPPPTTSTVAPPPPTTTSTVAPPPPPPTTTTVAPPPPTTTTIVEPPPPTSTVPPIIYPSPTPIRVHPEGPNGKQVVLENYQFNFNNGVLSGGAWAKPVGSAGATLKIVCSDGVGVFPATPYVIDATYLGPSTVSGYGYWTFTGVPTNGAAGMQFYLVFTSNGQSYYDSNGGAWYNYRIDHPFKFVPSGWKGRTIYQVMTDRFARTDGSTNACDQYTIMNDYCGGTWKGLQSKLDYIQNMGFDAIWMSGVIDNTPGGYHGYWPKNFQQLNSRFGTDQDLRNLIQACRDRNIYVMVDVIPNHVGPLNGNAPNQYPAPLNKASNYHNACNIDYFANPKQPQSTYEYCRINPVNPDLNTEDQETYDYLYNSMKWLDTTYGADGYRLDAVKHIRKNFWPYYVQMAGNKFCMGEVADGDTNYVADYQNYIPSVHAYPAYYTIFRNTFAYKGTMKNIDNQNYADAQVFKDVTLLGPFLDNQDQDRWLKLQPDLALFRNALAYLLFADGVPTTYQGTEQAFADAGNYRRPLWDSGYNTTPASGLYQWLAVMQKARRDIGRQQFVDSVRVKAGPDNPVNSYVFVRKPFLVALTNVGTGGSTTVRINASFGDFKTLRNVLIPTDTLAPGADGFYTITLNGEPKIYA
ncbi:Alpha-amylase A type-1/2 [Phlyctochytrium planicorne]|nr:Alpha-amylase A type-1/2 [Phlyctochytrium planicorne]